MPFHKRPSNDYRPWKNYSNQTAKDEPSRHFRKSFIDADGHEEEVYDQDPYHALARKGEKLQGYGMAYTHPRHLNEMGISMNTPDLKHGEIKSFKDMDKVLDHEEMMRVIDEGSDGRTISTGNNLTPNQMNIIHDQFRIAREDKVPLRVKVTSNSRKKFKTWNEFNKAVGEGHKGVRIPDHDNKEFNSHIGRLSENT